MAQGYPAAPLPETTMPEYREHLAGLGLSGRTLRIYELRIRQANEWCGEHGLDLDSLAPTQVIDLAHSFPNSASTRRQLRTALKHYWEMTERRNPPVRAVRVPRKPKGHCRALEPDDARALVKTALGWYPEGLAVLFGMYLALRATEIAEAEWGRFDGGWYTVTGKGDRTHTIPVHPVLLAELAAIKRRPDRFIFPGSRGRSAITSATVWNWVQKVADEADIGQVATHQLRHTALATANDALGDLRAVAEFARHARVETTMIYTRTTNDRLREVSTALDYF